MELTNVKLDGATITWTPYQTSTLAPNHLACKPTYTYGHTSTCGLDKCPCELLNRPSPAKERIMYTVPAKLSKVLSDDQQAMYRLGWIDRNTLEINDDGVTQMDKILADKFEKELGEAARAEIARREAEEKED